MKKLLQYESLIGFTTKTAKLTSIQNHLLQKNTDSLKLSDVLYKEYAKINNIEIVYQTKVSNIQQTVYMAKNVNNFNGGSFGLPFKSFKVTLSTRIVGGFYGNTWVALQNRNQYTPKLIVNGKIYMPSEVNGAFLRYQFHAAKSNSSEGKPENEISIHCALNPVEHVNSIVGIWFG